MLLMWSEPRTGLLVLAGKSCRRVEGKGSVRTDVVVFRPKKWTRKKLVNWPEPLALADKSKFI